MRNNRVEKDRQIYAKNLGRLYGWGNNNGIGMIFDLTFDGSQWHYRYFSLDSGNVFAAPARLWGGDVKWLTPVKPVDKSET